MICYLSFVRPKFLWYKLSLAQALTGIFNFAGGSYSDQEHSIRRWTTWTQRTHH